MIGQRRSRGAENSIYGDAMCARIILGLLVLCVAALAAPAHARIDFGLATEATMCPMNGAAPPDFDGADCSQVPLYDLDPQRREIWVKVAFKADPSALPAENPLGLFLSLKGSSSVWLNGEFLGSNGAPGPDRQSETPGRMDAIFYVPHDTIQDGANEIILRLSGHHGFITLNYPFHYLYIDEYANPSREILRVYGPSLLTFGVFFLGAIYFGVSAARRTAPGTSALLFLLSLLAITQLAIETARGLFPYDYPFHEIRVLLIAVNAAAFGLCLFFHIVFKFVDQKRVAVILAGLTATAAALSIPRGFDPKAVLGLFAPTTIAAVIAIAAAFRNKPGARSYAVALSLFLAVTLIFARQFLNVAFFYCVAALLLFLIGQQAILFAKERILRLDASDRARRLELALEQARQKGAPERLSVHSAGKTELVDIGDIVYCKGAGDYVEIAATTGARLLHLAKLHELEKELPQTFLRVHRSYIVNTSHVRSLTREANGVGALAMVNGESVPVSRRILPNVRSALQ